MFGLQTGFKGVHSLMHDILSPPNH